LLGFDICEQCVGLAEIAFFDCFLHIDLGSRNDLIAIRLRSCRFLNVLKALGDLKERGGEMLSRNVFLAEKL
jgi:hypothetical protein